MVYNIACDIDQVFAFHKIKDYPQARFFFNKGAVLTAIKTHYIYPGVLEFIRLLALTPNLKTSFYSAGKPERNNVLVPLLLNRALPESQFIEIKSKMRVLSREDLILSKEKDLISKYYNPCFNWISDTQKDLSKVLSGEELLENAVLIDDQSGNAANGQLFNFLKVPVAEAEDYASLIEKMKFYDPQNGTRFLKCLLNVSGSLQEDFVKDGRRIVISKLNDNFEIRFINFDGDIQIENIDLDDEELYLQLDYFYVMAVKTGCPMGVIEEPKVVENICNWVSQRNGKSRKICRRANRICYVVGLLFSALNAAGTEKISLSAALSCYQFKRNESNALIPQFHKLQKDERFYLLGMQKLKEVNPDYELINPHSYHFFSQSIISRKDQIILKSAMYNEF